MYTIILPTAWIGFMNIRLILYQLGTYVNYIFSMHGTVKMKLNFKAFDLYTLFKPCPFCGSKNIEIGDDSGMHDSCWITISVYCNSCGVSGPNISADCRNDVSCRHGEYEARKKWNHRA